MAITVPSVFVGGLPRDITQQSLRQLFDGFGSIVKVSTCRRGYAFIDFATTASAEAACAALDGMDVDGRPLGVRIQTEENRQSRKKKSSSDSGSSAGSDGGQPQEQQQPEPPQALEKLVDQPVLHRPDPLLPTTPPADDLRKQVMMLEQQSRSLRKTTRSTALCLGQVTAQTADLQARVEETQQLMDALLKNIQEEDARIQMLLPPEARDSILREHPFPTF